MNHRHEPADTTADEWEAVGWMVSNLQTEPVAIREAVATLDPVAITSPDAALIFRAIREVSALPDPSPTEVVAACRHADYAFQIGPLAEAMQSTRGTSPRVLRNAVSRIKEAHAQRRYRDALADAAAAGLDANARRENVEKILATFKATMPEEAEPTDATSIALRWSEENDEKMIETGFSVLDRRFGGGLPVGVTAIAAQPGGGKSALSAMLMLGALERDRNLRAVWFRGEMAERLLWSRFLAAWSAIRYPNVPRITRRAASRRSAAAQKVNADLVLTVGDRLHIQPPPLTPTTIVAAIERHQPGMAVVDYIQTCRADSQFPDKRSEIDHVIATLTGITTEREMATIVVSAMAGSRSSSTEIGAMTKETNKLDYDAHNYLSIWSDKRDRDRDPRPVRLEIAKGRTGGEGVVDLWFSGTSMTFTPQATEEEEQRSQTENDFAAFAIGEQR